MSKLICLTPRLLTPEEVEKQFVNTRYLRPLIKRGFNTLLLTLDNPNNEKILQLCDGFLITGGTDLDPKFYNEENEGLSKNVHDRLDELDKLVVKHAVKNKKPLLGICRGLQSINVFLGGSLIQDLDEVNETHNSVKENHEVIMDKNNGFNLPELIKVNSYHHQAIKKLAPDLKVIGRHKDNTIEMVVHNTLPIFAVQWHPEINSESDVSNILFDKFKELFD